MILSWIKGIKPYVSIFGSKLIKKGLFIFFKVDRNRINDERVNGYFKYMFTPS
jgi:hypothetical protein